MTESLEVENTDAVVLAQELPQPVLVSRKAALAVLLVGAFLPPLDYFIVNLALPAIRVGLHASEAQLQLIISAFASAYAVCLITGGRLGDLYGRKQMFMAGLAGFVLASALCGFASTAGVLIAGRILQGITASVIMPQVLATIRTIFKPEEQTRVMALFGSVFGLSSIVGQLGGGALISLHPFGLGWQSIFLVNIPVGIAALVGAAMLIPKPLPSRQSRIDLGGIVLLSLVLGLIIYPLTRGREAGWPAWTWICALASIPALAAFVAREHSVLRRGGDPLVDLRLFRNKFFVLGLVMAFLFYSISVFFMTYGIFLQDGLGWSPLTSGIAIMPFAVGFLIGPTLSSSLSRRLGDRVVNAGFFLLVLGFALAVWALQAGRGPDVLFYAGLVFVGLGQGFVLPSIVRIVLAEVDQNHAGLAAGLVTSTLQIGSAVGVAAVGSVFFTVLGHLHTAESYTKAFAASLSVEIAVLLVCLGLAGVLNRRHNKVHH